MFISTPSLEPGNNSQGTENSKRKLSHQNSPSAAESASPKQSGPAEQLKKSSSSFAQPSEGTGSFQLELNSENSSCTQKTQLFVVEEDSQATQIEEEEGTADADKSNSAPKHNSQTASKNGMDADPGKTSNSQSLSKVPESKSTSALPEKTEDCNPSQKLSQAANAGNQNIRATPSQLSVGADCVSDTPNSPQTSKTTAAGCSQVSPSADRPATPVPAPQQSPSQSVLTVSSQKNTENEKEHASQSKRLSQPMTHSHSLTTDSVRNAEVEERMDEGESQKTVKGDDTGVNLALSQSEVLSPEPMEEENGEKETSQRVPSRDQHSSSREDSFSIMVLEESQRVSQEKVKVGRSQPFISSSQPVRGSMQDKREAKISGSQPVGSTEVSPLQLERTKSQSTKPSDSGQHKVNSDNASNKSLSDSSGGGIKLQTNDLFSLLIM